MSKYRTRSIRRKRQSVPSKENYLGLALSLRSSAINDLHRVTHMVNEAARTSATGPLGTQLMTAHPLVAAGAKKVLMIERYSLNELLVQAILSLVVSKGKSNAFSHEADLAGVAQPSCTHLVAPSVMIRQLFPGLWMLLILRCFLDLGRTRVLSNEPTCQD
jgi:hypothetical protein